jgi:copper(I)-binding protein
MKLLFICSVLTFAFSTAGFAHEVKFGQLVIVHPMVDEAAKGQAVGNGSVAIRNDSAAADRLLSVTCECAETVTIEAGAPVAIPAGGTASVRLRFENIKRKLSQDEAYAGEMVFEKAGAVKLDLMVHSPHQ